MMNVSVLSNLFADQIRKFEPCLRRQILWHKQNHEASYFSRVIKNAFKSTFIWKISLPFSLSEFSFDIFTEVDKTVTRKSKIFRLSCFQKESLENRSRFLSKLSNMFLKSTCILILFWPSFVLLLQQLIKMLKIQSAKLRF